VLVYGHLDKQPEMTGWREGLGPWTPVIEGGKLYGRGGADDGYAVFCALAALRSLQEEKRPHARVAILIECCEESGSYDLPAYLEALAPRIGTPELVVGLDSGCGSYDQLWGTTSLRGLINGVLSVEVLTEGVHSGDASGVVAEGVRIARQLLERLEDAESGVVKPAAFHAQIPIERSEQAKRAADVLGEAIWRRFPFVKGMQPMISDLADLVLNRSWRPMLAVTGAEGLPAPANAGNVLRPKTALVLSLRLPPTVKADSAARQLQAILEADPPYGARVKFEYGQAATGWHAPPTAPWLAAAVDTSSIKNYGKSAMWMGEGGTIPFMAMLGARFPSAQFLITGVLGPQANAHGPNEFLHIEYAKRLTACVADVLAAHAVS
jgi:acetylornithine deacetylase/succinyl-diaminopimelate desuccinylase-like protein